MTASVGFRKMLAERQDKAKTLVCVGFDPLPEKLPECMKVGARFTEDTRKYLASISRLPKLADEVNLWMKRIIDATADFASMFKPQSAHWEAIPGGVEALQDLIRHIHTAHPGIPVFLDCKRGDIARTQQQYRVAHFDNAGVDGMNFSPYMGRDCMAALVDKENLGRALVGLCYTSNPDARQVQDLFVPEIHGAGSGRCLWEYFAEWILQWATELGVVENAGLVMAAAYEKPKKSGNVYSEHLTRCREIVGDKLWFLIPGVGTQGGFVKETVKCSYTGPGSIAINSSSEIDFASSGPDLAEAARQKARELRDLINQTL